MATQFKYYATRWDQEAEAVARNLRRRGLNANVYQHKFIIVGPATVNPFLPHKTVYESSRYEKCLENLLEGEKHKVRQIPAQ